MRPSIRHVCIIIMIFLSCGSYFMRSSEGGGEASYDTQQKVNPSDIALPSGYRIEAVATALTFPTGVTFDDAGNVYIVESGYSYGEVWTKLKLLRIGPDGKQEVVAKGEKNGPWTGLAYLKALRKHG